MMTALLSEAAWREAEDEHQSGPYGGYPNAMAQEAAWFHARNLLCPFDCGNCLSRADAEDTWGEVPVVTVRCGHCQGYHTVEGVRACSTASR